MTVSDRKTVTASKLYNCRTGEVYDAWLKPEIARQWLFATPECPICEIEIDAVVGGKFRLVRDEGSEKIEHIGEYKMLDKPRHLVFSFAVPKFSHEVTTVTLHIAATDDGALLELRHEGVLPEYSERTKAGWDMLLTNLFKLLEKN